MIIIIDKNDNFVIDVGIAVDYLPNGYPRIVERNISFDNNSFNAVEVDNLPNDFEPFKYCYTEADGFYTNPNWHEPSAYDLAPTEVVNAIIDEYTNELIEMGVL